MMLRGSVGVRAGPPASLFRHSDSPLAPLLCLRRRMTQTQLESTAVILPVLPVTFYSSPLYRQSKLKKTDTAGGGVGENFALWPEKGG